MNKLRLLLAVGLLVCLLPMPYGYFVLVRFAAMIVFGIMAYKYYEERKEKLALFFGVMALLFQPIIKISLGRTMWNVVDVVLAIVLLVMCYKDRQNK